MSSCKPSRRWISANWKRPPTKRRSQAGQPCSDRRRKAGASDIHMNPTKRNFVFGSVLTVFCSRSCRASKVERRHHFAREDHGEVGYQRAFASRRPHHAEDAHRGQEQLIFASAHCPLCGAKDRAPAPRQRESAARYDEAWLQSSRSRSQEGDFEAVRHGVGDGADRFR